MKFINDKVLTLTSIDCKMTESLNLTNKQQLQHVYVLNFLSINGEAQCWQHCVISLVFMKKWNIWAYQKHFW